MFQCKFELSWPVLRSSIMRLNRRTFRANTAGSLSQHVKSTTLEQSGSELYKVNRIFRGSPQFRTRIFAGRSGGRS